MSDYRIAVLDIGKTNKKLFVYDSDLRCLNPDEKGTVIPEVTIDGILCDDMAAIRRWMLAGLKDASEQFTGIRCVSISTHGATIALLGAKKDRYFPGDGGLVFPIVSYMQPVTPREEESFYEDVGLEAELLQISTATAPFGYLINHGKQIHWLKSRFPARFAKVTDILMFSQYVSYLLTGNKDAIEPTYIGCHGYLLGADGKSYSEVAKRLEVVDMLPPLPFVPSWHVMGNVTAEVARATGLTPETIVTVGVHDSNAALVPHFVASGRKFVVQDTGTWVVTMAPAKEQRFPTALMGKCVFLNRSVYGTPVMTTIFRGGAEFEYYSAKVFPQFARPQRIRTEAMRRVLERKEAFIVPTVERGSGLYPESAARVEGVDQVFADADTAWCVFDLCLAMQGFAGINLATRGKSRIVLQGSIAENNVSYAPLIRALYSGEREVVIGMGGGAPYGAAILGAAAVEGKIPEELARRVRLEVQPAGDIGLDYSLFDGYAERWFDLVNSTARRRPLRRRHR